MSERKQELEKEKTFLSRKEERKKFKKKKRELRVNGLYFHTGTKLVEAQIEADW